MIKSLLKKVLPFYKGYQKCVSSQIHNLTYFNYVCFKLFPNRHKYYYPIAKTCLIANPRKVRVGINSSIARPGCYIQGAGGVYIGKYVQFGPNVGILSANHDLYDQNKYNTAPIKIGDYSWIGMNSVVTAGVELGPRTIVAAGAVVTKSFPEGYCVLAGVPAKKIKDLEKDKFIPWTYENEYYGFLSMEEFKKNSKKWLEI